MDSVECTSLILHTGNVLSWNSIKRNPLLSSTEELVLCASATLRCWAQMQDKHFLQSTTNLTVECAKHTEVIPQEERDELRVSVKIYLSDNDPSYIRDAIESALSYIGIADIETVLLAFRGHTFCSPNIDITLLESLWRVLEEFVDTDVIVRLGVCDFNRAQLEELMHMARVKPSVNQVNFNSTAVLGQISQNRRINPTQVSRSQHACNAREELIEWAREQHVQLLTHNDKKEILPHDQLQDLMANVFTPNDGLMWNTDWVVRYSALFKNRAVVRSKGYLLRASRVL